MRLTGKYRYLTFEDRKKIEAWHLLGDRPVDIAARLSVHHTTIYKELQRGATGALDANQREGYSAELAERRLRESFKRRGKRAPAAQYLITYAGKSLGEKISRNRHGLDADGNPLPDPSGDTLNNEEAQG